MASLPPKPESPVKDDRRLDRARDLLTPARPMAPSHYRSERFSDTDRVYMPRPAPDTDTYIASYDSRRDPRDRERDRDREYDRRRDRDREREREWDRDRDFRSRDWRERERHYDWRRERDDRYSRRGYSPRRYESTYRRPASRSPPPRSRSRSPPPPPPRRRSRSRSPLPPPRRYSRSRSRSRSYSPRRTRPSYSSQIRSRPYSPGGRRGGPPGRSRTPSRSGSHARTHTSRSPPPSSKLLRLGNHSISDSPKIANTSRSWSRGRRERSKSRSPRSPTFGRSVKREESKDRSSKMTSPILRSQPLVSSHPKRQLPTGEASKREVVPEPEVKTGGLQTEIKDEPMPLSAQSDFKIESKDVAAREPSSVAPAKPPSTSPYLPPASSTRNASPLPPTAPRSARSPSPPKGPRASLATQANSTIPSSSSTTLRRTSRSPPKGPRNHSSYPHSHSYPHSYQHSSYPHPSTPTVGANAPGGTISMASGPMYPTGPRASRRLGSSMTPGGPSAGTPGGGGAGRSGSVAPVGFMESQAQLQTQSQPEPFMYWKHVLPSYDRPTGGRFGIAQLETELARLQTARTNHNHEFEQIARSTRRALHELDMATIDLRMAENRRKVADLQLEKAKHGVLGVDAAAAVVIDAGTGISTSGSATGYRDVPAMGGEALAS